MNCAIHAEVPGIGICISCRRVVCDGCSTRLQGRNFCSQCLSLRALQRDGDVESRSSAVVRYGLGVLTVIAMGVLSVTVFAAGFFLYMVG